MPKPIPVGPAIAPFAPLRSFISMVLLFRTARSMHDGIFTETPKMGFTDVGGTAQFVLTLGTNPLNNTATRNCQARGDNKEFNTAHHAFTFRRTAESVALQVRVRRSISTRDRQMALIPARFSRR